MNKMILFVVAVSIISLASCKEKSAEATTAEDAKAAAENPVNIIQGEIEKLSKENKIEEMPEVVAAYQNYRDVEKTGSEARMKTPSAIAHKKKLDQLIEKQAALMMGKRDGTTRGKIDEVKKAIKKHMTSSPESEEDEDFLKPFKAATRKAFNNYRAVKKDAEKNIPEMRKLHDKIDSRDF